MTSYQFALVLERFTGALLVAYSAVAIAIVLLLQLRPSTPLRATGTGLVAVLPLLALGVAIVFASRPIARRLGGE